MLEALVAVALLDRWAGLTAWGIRNNMLAMAKPKTTRKKATKFQTIRSADVLKSLIEEERAELDRLDNHGSAPMARDNCVGRLNALVKELKDSHGLDA